jgi:quercetin dioxygenase-like cupin family protein
MSDEVQRPFKPIEISSDTFADFSYTAIAASLRSEPAYESTGRTALAIARSDALTIVLTVIKSGAHIKDHKAPGPGTVVVLDGHLKFNALEKQVTLKKHDTAVFARDMVHSLEAMEDSCFLLVIGGRAA